MMLVRLSQFGQNTLARDEQLQRGKGVLLLLGRDGAVEW